MQEAGVPVAFGYISDAHDNHQLARAPTFYVNGQPDRRDPHVRKLEHDLVATTALDPYVNGGTRVPIGEQFADTVGEKALHMVNSDPARTPTFTMFGNPDFFFQTSTSCGANPCVNPGFAWNHGDVQDEIANTWMGIVGPGVRTRGIEPRAWTDHTNVRPTMLALLGRRDDYRSDGRVLVSALRPDATPRALKRHGGTVRALGDVYERLNASFDEFALATLKASTVAIASTDEAKYERIERAIAALTAQRDALAPRIESDLEDAAFRGRALDERRARAEIDEAQRIVAAAHCLADAG
jgi:hypothetical protein